MRNVWSMAAGKVPRPAVAVLTAFALMTTACGGSSATDTTLTVTTLAVTTTTASTSTTSTTSTTTTTTTSTIPVPQLTVDSKLSTAGLGPVRTWMTVEEAITAAGLDLVGELDPTISPNCYYVTPDDEELAGVMFMVFEGRVARVEVHAPSTIETPSGVKVGMTEQEILDKFGDRVQESTEFRVDGKALVYFPEDEDEADNRVVFEIDEGFVTAMRAGRVPAVQFGEGCA